MHHREVRSRWAEVAGEGVGAHTVGRSETYKCAATGTKLTMTGISKAGAGKRETISKDASWA